MTLTDQSTGIREGEELDAAQIDPYLKAHIPGLTGTPRISQFPGGASSPPDFRGIDDSVEPVQERQPVTPDRINLGRMHVRIDEGR